MGAATFLEKETQLRYKIRIRYETGDSFHTEEDEDILEPVWENLQIVGENIERIKIHNEYYKFVTNMAHYDKTNPWVKDKTTKVPEYIIKDLAYYPSLKIKLDSGKEFQMHPNWCGYFEKLLGVEVFIEDGVLPSYYP